MKSKKIIKYIKISLATRGKKKSEEHKQALKIAWLKRKEKGLGTPWNKGKRGAMPSYAGFQKGHKAFAGTEATRFQKGNKPPYSYMEMPLVVREKISLARKKEWNSGLRVGHKQSEETRLKLSEAHKGEKSLLWKGGITTKNKLERARVEIKLWREKIFEKDNYTCQACGDKSGNGYTVILNAHHIKSFAKYPELRTDIENGITLCVPCHKKTDTYLSNSYKLFNEIENRRKVEELAPRMKPLF